MTVVIRESGSGDASEHNLLLLLLFLSHRYLPAAGSVDARNAGASLINFYYPHLKVTGSSMFPLRGGMCLLEDRSCL